VLQNKEPMSLHKMISSHQRMHHQQNIFSGQGPGNYSLENSQPVEFGDVTTPKLHNGALRIN
jgi:hypothetical protein